MCFLCGEDDFDFTKPRVRAQLSKYPPPHLFFVAGLTLSGTAKRTLLQFAIELLVSISNRIFQKYVVLFLSSSSQAEE